MKYQIYYLACWTEDNGVYSCVHKHTTVQDAMKCLIPDGGCFIRANEKGTFRSLNDAEYMDFSVALLNMPWRAVKRK
jgi:hypothetical protein